MIEILFSQNGALMPSILGAAANLIAVSAALIAFLPFLLSAAKASNPDFFTMQEVKRRISDYANLLIGTLILFSSSMLCCVLSLAAPSKMLLVLTVGQFLAAVGLLLFVGMAFANMAKKSEGS